MAMITTEKDNNKVIQFPKNNNGNTNNPDVILERIQTQKTVALYSSMEFLIPPLIEALYSIGINMEEREDRVLLLITMIKCIISEHLKLPHILTEFLDEHEDEISKIIDSDTEDDVVADA